MGCDSQRRSPRPSSHFPASVPVPNQNCNPGVPEIPREGLAAWAQTEERGTRCLLRKPALSGETYLPGVILSQKELGGLFKLQLLSPAAKHWQK